MPRIAPSNEKIRRKQGKILLSVSSSSETRGSPHTILLKLCVHKDLYKKKLLSEFQRFYRILGFCNFPETI